MKLSRFFSGEITCLSNCKKVHHYNIILVSHITYISNKDQNKHYYLNQTFSRATLAARLFFSMVEWAFLTLAAWMRLSIETSKTTKWMNEWLWLTLCRRRRVKLHSLLYLYIHTKCIEQVSERYHHIVWVSNHRTHKSVWSSYFLGHSWLVTRVWCWCSFRCTCFNLEPLWTSPFLLSIQTHEILLLHVFIVFFASFNCCSMSLVSSQ